MKYYRLFFGISILIALALPLFHMNTAEITEQENRTLAKFPKMRKKGKLNTNYGKEFESWLGDRFWGRDQLIDTRFQALYKINGRIENEHLSIYSAPKIDPQAMTQIPFHNSHSISLSYIP